MENTGRRASGKFKPGKIRVFSSCYLIFPCGYEPHENLNTRVWGKMYPVFSIHVSFFIMSSRTEVISS